MTGRIEKLWLLAAAFGISAASVAFAHDPKKKSIMDDVCGEHHSAAMKASEQTSMHLAEAKRSDILGEMRKHVEAAEKAHTEMKTHLSTCMSMMHETHGGMMGHAETTAAKVVDPVCQMEVDSKTAPSSTYKGKTYYFCSAQDKAAFDKNPDKYVRTN